MNFYLNAVDDLLCHPDEKPSIGLVLCQDKNHIVAEYALRGVNKSIGISAYQLTRALPEALKSNCPQLKRSKRNLVKTGGGTPKKKIGYTVKERKKTYVKRAKNVNK